MPAQFYMTEGTGKRFGFWNSLCYNHPTKQVLSEQAELWVFLRCSQCGADPEEDSGMMEKLERKEKYTVRQVKLSGLKK